MRFQIQTKLLNTCLRLLLRHQLETASFDNFSAVRSKIRDVNKMLASRSQCSRVFSPCLTRERLPVYFQVARQRQAREQIMKNLRCPE